MSAIDKGVLALKLPENDAGAATVRDYLVKLLEDVWQQREGFDGKRPFGNSGWYRDLTDPLIADGSAHGGAEAEVMILCAIMSLQ